MTLLVADQMHFYAIDVVELPYGGVYEIILARVIIRFISLSAAALSY
jgi:hypothetical protein